MKPIDEIRRENIAALEAECGGLSKLSARLERSDSQVSQWKLGSINSGTGKQRGMSTKTARYIEGKMGKQLGWMDADHSLDVEARMSKSKINVGNVDAARAFTGEVPVISWVQAGSWHEAQDLFQPGDAERYLPIIRGHSTCTYALRVNGDSMTAPFGKSYPAGCYIIVDPSKNMPANGDRIIAKLVGSDAVTFKVYKEEDGRKWLAPLNTSHPPIIEPFRVLGTVIGKWEDD